MRDTLREAFTNMRVGHAMLLCQIGSMSNELTRENTQRFAQDVMPHLRDLWAEVSDYAAWRLIRPTHPEGA